MSSAYANDAEKVAAIRSHLPSTAVSGYFNAGTNGPLAASTMKALIDSAQSEYEKGRIGPGLYEGLAADAGRLRGLMGEFLGCGADEIALMRSTTEGMNAVLMGLDWQRGDEVITTNLEHVCLFSILALLSHKYGVVIRMVDIGNGSGDTVKLLEQKVNPRTRVIAISHVQWSSGAIMPLREISDMAHSHNVLVVVDAAQGAGNIVTNVKDLGVDAYCVAGQKWLCGPNGTGTLYLDRELLSMVRPPYIRYGQFDTTGYIVPQPGAKRYEMGEFFNPAILGQEASIRFLQDVVGVEWGMKRVSTLGQRAWDGLSKLDGVTMVTPRDLMAGLVSIQVAGMHPKDVTAAAYEKGYTIRYVDMAPCPVIARISTGWWNTEDEVDGLVQVIGEIAHDAAAAAAK